MSSQEPTPIELVYRHVDGIEIAMDVYLPEKATKEEPAPILLWWHAGGLLQGTRKAIAPHARQAPSRHNICVVSADYRLAPQTRLPGILADCKSAIEFLHSAQFAEATDHRADPSRLIVSGSSAGGWLALMAGTGIGYKASGIEPPEGISGIVAIYPMTDILDPFWNTEQKPVVYIGRIIDHAEMATFIDPGSEKTSWAELTGKRSLLYPYMLQEAILSQLLLEGTGIEPIEYSIAQNIRAGKVSMPLLPTYIITGNKDTRVTHQQSLDVVAAYKNVGTQAEYNELDGLDHRFDEDDQFTEQMQGMYSFIKNIL